MKKPDFIIIGAQKSASTFVQDCLAEHPDVFMLPGEVPILEDPDYKNSPIVNLLARFNGIKEKMGGFKRPNYLGKPEVPPRVRKHFPDAKLIAILRDPVARAVSAFYHNINYGFLPLEEIEVLLKKIFEGKEIEGYSRSKELVEFGLYCKYLSLYKEYIEEGKLLILIHDDIKENKQREIKRVYEFLGLDTNFIPSSLNSRPQAAVYNFKRLKFLQKKNQLIYNYQHGNSRLEKKDGFFYKLIRYLFVTFDQAVLSKIWSNKRDELSDDLKLLLYRTYKSDIECLEDKFGLKLDKWKKKYEVS